MKNPSARTERKRKSQERGRATKLFFLDVSPSADAGVGRRGKRVHFSWGEGYSWNNPPPTLHYPHFFFFFRKAFSFLSTCFSSTPNFYGSIGAEKREKKAILATEAVNAGPLTKGQQAKSARDRPADRRRNDK